MPESVHWRDRHQLPKQPGLYYCWSGFWPFKKLLYIGETKNFQERWTDNYGYGVHQQTAALTRLGCNRISYRIIRSESRRKHEEAIAIRRHHPPLNRRRESANYWLSTWDSLGEVLLSAACFYLAWLLLPIVWRAIAVG